MMPDKKGAVLLITVFIILLGSILVIGFLEIAATDIEIQRNLKSDVVATYIADAGVDAAVYDLLNAGDGNIARTEFPDTADNNTYYTVVQTAKDGNTYTLESTGEFGDFERTIEVVIEVAGIAAVVEYWKEI